MTHDELKAIKARAGAVTQAVKDPSYVDPNHGLDAIRLAITSQCDVNPLIAEVERYRSFSVVNWGDSPIAQSSALATNCA